MEDAGGDGGEFGDEIDGIVKSRVPELLLVDTLIVFANKHALGVERGDGSTELCHGMDFLGETVDQGLFFFFFSFFVGFLLLCGTP